MTKKSYVLADGLSADDLRGLKSALRTMFGGEIIVTSCQVQPLKGGAVGEVRLITGLADTATGSQQPFRLVQKTQKKWERHGDPGSWRREYDLYRSGLGALFDDTLRWPACLHAETNDDQSQTRIWMEFIDGATGYDLMPDMLEQAAYALGRFQGRLYVRQPDLTSRLTNLSGISFMKNRWLHIRSWQALRDYIRSDSSGLPAHLCQMLIEADEGAEDIE